MLFCGHETFHIRDGWLHKGINAVHRDPMVFADPHATDVLGVGRNMVKAMRYWLMATGLADERSVKDDEGKRKPEVRLTSLGRLVLRRDPYFEEELTLWTLHHGLATNSKRATAWYWTFSEFPMSNFDGQSFVTYLSRWADQRNKKKKIQTDTLKKDMNCVMRTYTPQRTTSRKGTPEDVFDCPLSILGLVDAFETAGNFRINVTNRAIPEPVFAYALLDFMDRQEISGSNISFKELSSQPGSPGRVFALSGDGVLENLARLESRYGRRAFAFSRTAGLNVLKVKRQNPETYLIQGYKELKR